MSEETKPGTAIATTEERAPLAVTPREKMGAIVPTTIEQAYRLSQMIVHGGMAPKSYENKPERVMVAIMHGLEVGMTPMAAVQSIAVINGFPTIWGDGALGLVRASGLLEDIQERIEQTGNGELVAVCVVKRRGQTSSTEGRFSWSEAVRAGLTKKVGPWQQYPRRMMQMRARSWALRDAFADVLRGLHAAEEIIDMQDTPLPRPTRQEVREEEQRGAPPSFPRAEAERDEAAITAEAEAQHRAMDREAAGKPDVEEPEEPIEQVPLYAMKGDKGKSDWPKYVADASAAIDAITDRRTLQRWRTAHKGRLDTMPPSYGDQIRARLDARDETLSTEA